MHHSVLPYTQLSNTKMSSAKGMRAKNYVEQIRSESYSNNNEERIKFTLVIQTVNVLCHVLTSGHDITKILKVSVSTRFVKCQFQGMIISVLILAR